MNVLTICYMFDHFTLYPTLNLVEASFVVGFIVYGFICYETFWIIYFLDEKVK